MRLELMWLIHSRNVGVKECEFEAKKCHCVQWKCDDKKEAIHGLIYFKMICVKCIKLSVLR